jgi:hypothetical protein
MVALLDRPGNRGRPAPQAARHAAPRQVGRRRAQDAVVGHQLARDQVRRRCRRRRARRGRNLRRLSTRRSNTSKRICSADRPPPAWRWPAPPRCGRSRSCCRCAAARAARVRVRRDLVQQAHRDRRGWPGRAPDLLAVLGDTTRRVVRYKIAVIAGDGIGKEVMPEGLRALEAAAPFRHRPRIRPFDWASCDYYLEHGQMMPDDWKAQIGRHDAIYFGAVGWPDTVPDTFRCGARCSSSAASSTSTSTCARCA